MAGFNIRLDALKTTVLAALPNQKANPVNGDQTFIKPLTDFLAAEIGKLDPKFNGVLVLSSGEFNPEAGRTQGTFQIVGKIL